jgi:hypothetical protein
VSPKRACRTVGAHLSEMATSNDTGLLNFRFEHVANSFIQALECTDFPVRRAITLIEKDFPVLFVDTNDDVFLCEKSFATWHEALDRDENLPVHKNSSRTWRAGRQRAACPDAGVPDGREERVPSE